VYRKSLTSAEEVLALKVENTHIPLYEQFQAQIGALLAREQAFPLVVREHKALQVCYQVHKRENAEAFPVAAPRRAQCGPRLRAQAVDLAERQCVPYARLRRLLGTGFGDWLSASTPVRLVRQVADRLQEEAVFGGFVRTYDAVPGRGLGGQSTAAAVERLRARTPRAQSSTQPP
jgi:hypothetical protein